MPNKVVEQIDKHQCIAILILVDDETEFVKQQPRLHFRPVCFASLIHLKAHSPTDGFQDELVVTEVGVFASHYHAAHLLEKFVVVDLLLILALATLTSADEFRIGIPVYCERTERRKFVGGACSALDEGRLPVLISADGAEVGERKTKGKGMTWVSY